MDSQGDSNARKRKRVSSEENVDHDSITDCQTSNSIGYGFINYIFVFSTISNLVVCKNCHGDVKFSTARSHGLGFSIVLECNKACKPEHIPSSPPIRDSYDINKRFICAMKILGLGFEGVKSFFSSLSMHHNLDRTMYDTIITQMNSCAEKMNEALLGKSVKSQVIQDQVAGNLSNKAAVKVTASEQEISTKRGLTSVLDVCMFKTGFKAFVTVLQAVGNCSEQEISLSATSEDNITTELPEADPKIPGKIIIDGKDSVTCAFNEGYKEFTYEGEVHRIKLGTPMRELYIDDKWYHCVFGSHPISVDLGSKRVNVALEGPIPRIETDKHTNFVKGKINLTINVQTTVSLFLDAKPQMFQIEGKPCTIEFIDALETVLLDGQPFKPLYGGPPQLVPVHGKKQWLQFSALPERVSPGWVKITGMRGKQARGK